MSLAVWLVLIVVPAWNKDYDLRIFSLDVRLFLFVILSPLPVYLPLTAIKSVMGDILMPVAPF